MIWLSLVTELQLSYTSRTMGDQSMHLDRTCCVLMHQGQSAGNHTHHVRRSRTLSQPSCCLGRVGCCFVKPQTVHVEKLSWISIVLTAENSFPLGDFTQHAQLSWLNIYCLASRQSGCSYLLRFTSQCFTCFKLCLPMKLTPEVLHSLWCCSQENPTL